MKELRTEIEIHAPAERVWQVLADFPAYPQWNPFIRYVHGEPRQGTTVGSCAQPSGAKPLTFKATILRAEPGRELCWCGRLPIPGLFAGRHSFLIEPLGPDRVRFVHREEFTGLLVPLFMRWYLADARRGFTEMNEALKTRAES
jgi:hypothetical protein